MSKRKDGADLLADVPSGDVMALGVKQQTVWAWKNRTRTPDAFNRRLLNERFGIPEDSWFTDEELRQLRNARRAG